MLTYYLRLRIFASMGDNSSVVSAAASRPEVSGLTGLRFIAAFSVAIAHGSEQTLRFSNQSPQFVYWISQISALGMGLFFVLSGFVIHYNYRVAVTQGGLDGLGGFVWARFSRLYPLYFFMLILDVLLGRKLFDFMAGRGDAFIQVLYALPYYLTFTQSWTYRVLEDSSLIYVTGINSALTWSISTEWFFYLSFPLIALLVIRIRRSVSLISAGIILCIFWVILDSILCDHETQINAWAVARYGSLAAAGTQDSFFLWLMYFSPYLRIGEFALGCVIAQLYVQLQAKIPSELEYLLGRLLLTAGVLSVPLMTFLLFNPGGQGSFFSKLHYNFGYAPSVAVILFCSARYDTLFSRILNSRPFVALGEASYSIYLTHFLIFVLAASFLGASIQVTMPNLIFLICKYLFLLLLIALISLGLHAFIEVPARQWLRGIWRKAATLHIRLVPYLIFGSPAVAAASLLLAVSFSSADTAASTAGGLRIKSASYGLNCRARQGNATRMLSTACNGKDACNYVVDVNVLGDPAPGCVKNFVVDYQCAPDNKRLTAELPAEAGLKSRLQLSCATPTTTVKPGAVVRQPSFATATRLPSESSSRLRASEMAATQATPVSEGGDGIRVLAATYGGNCGSKHGNATSDAQMSCDGESKCAYAVDVGRLGDPAPGCSKALTLRYECGSNGAAITADIPGEASLGKSVVLSCPTISESRPTPPGNWIGIRVLSATYGGNCGAPVGDVTDDMRKTCATGNSCQYRVSVNKLGDPAPGCSKSFFVKYQCGGETGTRIAGAPPEAGLGSLVHLSCP